MACRSQPPEPAAAADAQVLRQLKEAGSDLTKPHAVEFFLYLPTEIGARAAAEELTARSYDTKIDQAATGDQWLCLATRSFVPTQEAIDATRAEFEALATRLAGEYDGWGTPVVK